MKQVQEPRWCGNRSGGEDEATKIEPSIFAYASYLPSVTPFPHQRAVSGVAFGTSKRFAAHADPLRSPGSRRAGAEQLPRITRIREYQIRRDQTANKAITNR